jgi:hypothetical protein
MKKLKWSLVALTVTLGGLLLWQFLAHREGVNPEVYSGDGTIRDISFNFLIWNVPGYEISFPEFSLGQEQSLEYKLVGLPAIDMPAYVYFRVRGTEEKEDLGIVTILVKDFQNREVSALREKQLKEMIWSSKSLDPNFEIYDLEKSRIVPKEDAKYNIEVIYKPNPEVDYSEMVASIYLRCGGSL